MTISPTVIAVAVKHRKYRIVEDSLREMNHKVTLAIAAIVAATALTAMPFATPQQALAYKHHNHNNHNNSLKVDQQINQLNNCTTALCDNQANFGPPPAVVVWH